MLAESGLTDENSQSGEGAAGAALGLRTTFECWLEVWRDHCQAVFRAEAPHGWGELLWGFTESSWVKLVWRIPLGTVRGTDLLGPMPFCSSELYLRDLYGNSAAAAKSLQSCLTLCDPVDGSPPGSPVPGILQARTLEWVAISFSNARKWKMKGKSLSSVQLLAPPWTAAHQAPPSMGFSRQEHWSGVPLPSLIWQLYPMAKDK